MLRLNHHKSIESEENIVSLINDSILKLVKITDTNLHVLDSYSERKRGVVTLIIEAKLSYPLTHCPHCHSEALIKNGYRLARAKLPSINGDPVRLRVHKQRYLCHHCGHTCGARSNSLSFNHTLTPGVAQQTIKLAKLSLAGTTIATLTGISNTSVTRIINAEVHRPYRLKKLPERLQVTTLRLWLFKVAGKLVTSGRQLYLKLSRHHVYQDLFYQLLARIQALQWG